MNKQDLLDKLQLISPALSTDNYVEILKHFCFYEDCIVAHDGKWSMVVDFENDFDCAIPGKLLTDILETYSADEIIIKKKKEVVEIGKGKSKSRLSIMDSEQFVFEMSDTDELNPIKVDGNFIEGLVHCLISVNDDVQEVSQCGITVDVKKKGKVFYSTDGECISCYGYKSKGKPKEFLLPKVFCEQLVKLQSKFNDGELFIGDTFVQAEFEGIIINSKIEADIDYLDFEEVMSEFTIDEHFDMPDKIKSILERSIIITGKEQDKAVDITISENQMLLETVVAGTGEGKERVKVKGLDLDVKFRMDAGSLKRAFEACDQFNFVETEGKVSFVGIKENFIHLVSSYGDIGEDEDDE